MKKNLGYNHVINSLITRKILVYDTCYKNIQNS